MTTNEQKTAKQVIEDYLKNFASKDELFAAKYSNPNKNINECFDFILGEAKKRGQAVCMTDEEVFGLAVHYYDEADLKVEKMTTPHQVSTTAPKKVTLTKEQKEALNKKAEEEYKDSCKKAIMKREAEKKKAQQEKKSKAIADQMKGMSVLFDFEEDETKK